MMCTFGIFCGLSFSCILMTHATAPRSARTLAQARPTMSCIHLVVSSWRYHHMVGMMALAKNCIHCTIEIEVKHLNPCKRSTIFGGSTLPAVGKSQEGKQHLTHTKAKFLLLYYSNKHTFMILNPEVSPRFQACTTKPEGLGMRTPSIRGSISSNCSLRQDAFLCPDPPKTQIVAAP